MVFCFAFYAGLIRLQELFRASQKSSLKITVRKLEAVNGNYIPILKSLRDKGESRIVVDCHVSQVFQVLKQVSPEPKHVRQLLCSKVLLNVDLTAFGLSRRDMSLRVRLTTMATHNLGTDSAGTSRGNDPT